MRIVKSSTNNPELNKLLGLPPIHFIILEGDEKEPEPGVLPDSCLCILREVKTYSVSGLFFKRKEEIIHYRIHWIAKEFEAYTSAGGYRISYAPGSVIGETNLDGLREIMLDRDYTLHLLEGIYRNTKQLSDVSVENVYDVVAKQTAADLLREQTNENMPVPEETVEKAVEVSVDTLKEGQIISPGSIVEVSDFSHFPEEYTFRRIFSYHAPESDFPFWVFTDIDGSQRAGFKHCRIVPVAYTKISERGT